MDHRQRALLASSPSADRKTIVILGPSLKTLVTATHAPTSAATIGMNQTRESRVRFLGRPSIRTLTVAVAHDQA